KYLVISTGGKAAPEFGCSGDGYQFAKSFGHTPTKTLPILTGLTSPEIHQLKGVRAKGVVTLYLKGKKLCTQAGEIQFTEDGLSGICIFNLSRFVKLAKGVGFSDYCLSIDFAPTYPLEQLIEILNARKTNHLDLLHSFVHRKLCKELETRGTTPEELANVLKDFQVTLSGAYGWKKAQCTAGGIALTEIHQDTMESKLVKGLYFTGEVIDYDGPCGGYNLQNAWETAITAGRALANV
ncbi:MAG: aminoacetone oxidase family FAD-binding enzyme, partial [Anaerovoracaceae bacterium]